MSVVFRGLWGAQGRRMSRSLFVGLWEKELWNGGAITLALRRG